MRTLHSSATDPDAFLALHHRLWNRSNTASRIIIPHGHLGYHGIPVCGRQLQALPIIRCNFPDLEVRMIGIVRDLWRVKGPQRVCLDLIRGSLKLLQEEFRRLGVRESLVENFIVCHKDMWRHVVRPGSWHRSSRANAESTSWERKVVFWLGLQQLQHISLATCLEMSGVLFTEATLDTSRFLENFGVNSSNIPVFCRRDQKQWDVGSNAFSYRNGYISHITEHGEFGLMMFDFDVFFPNLPWIFLAIENPAATFCRSAWTVWDTSWSDWPCAPDNQSWQRKTHQWSSFQDDMPMLFASTIFCIIMEHWHNNHDMIWYDIL